MFKDKTMWLFFKSKKKSLSMGLFMNYVTQTFDNSKTIMQFTPVQFDVRPFRTITTEDNTLKIINYITLEN